MPVFKLFYQSSSFVMLGVLACAMLIACKSQSSSQPSNIVRQIDHVLIATSAPNELFSLLTDILQLPVAWPMTDYGSFASGGVAIGNANLEIIRDSKPAKGTVRSRWTGFALEPEPLRVSMAQMDMRGIRYGAPAPFRSKTFKVRWTTVGLPDLSSGGPQVFLCEYADDMATRRLRLLEQLQSRDGGPLKVLSIKEMVLGARDVKRKEEHWQKLLDPIQASSQGVWPVGAGPEIRVIEANKDGIAGLVIYVKSLPQARRFLKEHGLLGAEQASSLSIAGSLLQGLNITLVEGRSGR